MGSDHSQKMIVAAIAFLAIKIGMLLHFQSCTGTGVPIGNLLDE
jgi:hypothetical protein